MKILKINKYMEELPQLLPINIIITSFNRMNMLERTINSINNNTVYPYKIFVVDNASTDGSVGYLKTAKTQGKIFDTLFLEKNDGQSVALNKAFAWMQEWEKRRPSDDYFITTNEDILAPNLGNECWLTQLKSLFDKYGESHNIGAIALRIERTSRTDINENEELIRMYKNIPSVFRMLKRSDMAKLGEAPFRKLNHYDSNSMATTMETRLMKRFYLATHIYASHIGFTANKGYQEGFKDYFTYSGEHKDNIHEDKPYPEIDPETFVPIRAKHHCDDVEQKLRDEYRAKLRGEIKDPEITVIVLTYNRYDGLKKIIESVRKNTNDIKYNLLVVVDGDDTEAYNYCQEQNIQCLLSNVNRDFTAQANLGIYACQTPYFFILADDMEVIQSNWLSESLRIFKEKFPDNIGIMTVDEGLQHGRIFTTGISSKKFVYFAGGNFYYPKYIHYGGDNELSTWTKHLNLYHYAESIKVNHFHPSHGVEELKAEDDETYEISQPYMHQDQVLKKQRKSDLDKLTQDKNYYDYL
jgi:glycosyltransferase involved in cell wall biosynthesis